MSRKRKPVETDVCPHCGAEFRSGRLACPECGSDAETGWSEDGITGYHAGLPDEFTEDDYEDVLRGMGVDVPSKPTRANPWKVIGIVMVIVAFILFAMTYRAR